MEILCQACAAILPRTDDAVHHLKRCPGYDTAAQQRHADAVEHDASRIDELFLKNDPDSIPYTSDKGVWLFPFKRAVLLKAIFDPAVRKGARKAFANLYFNLAEVRGYDHNDLEARLGFTGFCLEPTVYYRKISQGEFDAIDFSGTKPHAPAFGYQKTDLYRWWISSSLGKVRVFGNDKASDDGNRIIKITFNRAPRGVFALKPHQMPGVQGDAKAVALHMEGFAEKGPFNMAKHLDEIFEGGVRHHNLGFTSHSSAALAKAIRKIEVVD